MPNEEGQTGGGGRISAQQLDFLLRGLDGLPMPLKVSTRLIEKAVNSHTDRQIVDEVLPLLRADASMTAWLLRKAAQETSKRAQTVCQAIEALDMQELRDSILSFGPDATSQDALPEQFDLQGFSLHCLAVATASEKLSQHLPRKLDGDLAFTCGILHDVGKLVLASLFPKAYERALATYRFPPIDLAQSERMLLGLDHTVAGRRLAELWRLPLCIQQAIWLHHLSLEATPASASGRELGALVRLADAVCHQKGIGLSAGHLAANPARLAVGLGIDLDDLYAVTETLSQDLPQLAASCGLGQPCDPKQPLKALEAANKELGSANRRLRHQFRELEQKAATHDRLAKFASGLREHLAVRDVLACIMSAVCEASESANTASAAYSLDPQTGHILVASVNPQGDATWRSFCASDLNKKAACPNEMGLSMDDINILLNDPDSRDDWFDAAFYRHHPLVFSGSRIGGLVLPLGQPCEDLLAEIVSATLALAQASERATALGEELVTASGNAVDRQAEFADRRLLDLAGQIAAGAAHEINTPLAVISGRAQLMGHKASSEQDKRTWELISHQAQRISDVVTDLMEFASPAKPKSEVLNVRELIEQAVSTFRNSDHPQAACAGVDIDTVDASLSVWADRVQIRDALAELVANAAAAISPSESVRVRAESDSAGLSAVVTVSDSGSGMDAQAIEDAFTPLVSLQRAGRRRGMGLPKAKRKIEINNGTVWIDSTPGEGTSVRVQLPLDKPQLKAE